MANFQSQNPNKLAKDCLDQANAQRGRFSFLYSPRLFISTIQFQLFVLKPRFVPEQDWRVSLCSLQTAAILDVQGCSLVPLFFELGGGMSRPELRVYIPQVVSGQIPLITKLLQGKSIKKCYINQFFLFLGFVLNFIRVKGITDP